MRSLYLALCAMVSITLTSQTWASQDDFDDPSNKAKQRAEYQSLGKHSSDEEEQKPANDFLPTEQPQSFCVRNKWFIIGGAAVLTVATGIGTFLALLCNPGGPSIRGQNCTLIQMPWTGPGSGIGWGGIG